MTGSNKEHSSTGDYQGAEHQIDFRSIANHAESAHRSNYQVADGPKLWGQKRIITEKGFVPVGSTRQELRTRRLPPLKLPRSKKLLWLSCALVIILSAVFYAVYVIGIHMSYVPVNADGSGGVMIHWGGWK